MIGKINTNANTHHFVVTADHGFIYKRDKVTESDKIGGVTPIELIYKWLQIPLQGFGDSLVGVIVFETLIPLLWWFGVHGATVVGSVSGPIATTNNLENADIFQKLIASGMSRSEAVAAMPANGGHIFTDAFVNCFQAITGSGVTMGLVIFMVFFAKSTFLPLR